MNFICYGHTYPNRALLHPLRSDVSHLPGKKPILTDWDISAKKQLSRKIRPNDPNIKDWTAVAWPTNIQSRTPDGKFGPAKQMKNWGDCWFMSALSAVANDEDGQNILAESIKKVHGGYHVTFMGSPQNTVFISESELAKCLDENGGDADTRLMELSADRFFSAGRGKFKSLFIAANLKRGKTQAAAEKCLHQYCRDRNVRDLSTYNPIRVGSSTGLSFFMLTGMNTDVLSPNRPNTMQRSNIMAYLNQYVTNDRDGASVALTGLENPLGNGLAAGRLVRRWDVIRTEITSNGTVDPQQRAFLNALERWLETRSLSDMKALWSAASELKLQYTNPEEFVDLLTHNRWSMSQEHFNLLRSGVQEVLAGGPGFIGFSGNHCGIIEGINEAMNTFTYSEPHFPTVVHTGELSSLVQAIRSGNVFLSAVEPTTGRDYRKLFEHSGQKRGRHLRQIHNQAVKDGKIDSSESGPLANLMELNDGAFWQLYDSDKNGVIEGGELKAVQLLADRWVEHLELTPIW